LATLQSSTIPDGGTLGSVSDADAISISAGGVVSTSAGLDVSAGTLTTSTAQKQAISATAFASGTKMIFNQTAAPTGWTKDTTNNNDSALRVVTGTVSTGGSVAFTTAMASQAISAHTLSVSGHTLSTSEMPSHTHTYSYSYQSGGGGHDRYWEGRHYYSTPASGGTGSTGSHSHSMGGSQTHSNIDLAVKYVDIIIAEKD